jgi:transcriptional regulator with XRE-family HTH domain
MSLPKRPILSDAHVQLGRALREVREALGLSTRQVPGFTTGQVSSVENGHTVPSLDFVETYIRLGGNGALLLSLYEQMRAVSLDSSRQRRAERKSGRSTVLDIRPPENIGEVRDHSDVQQHYIKEVNDAHYVFNSQGIIEEMRCAVTIRAKRPGVRLFYTGLVYDADRRRGVIRVDEGEGGMLVAAQESDTGSIHAYFDLGYPLEPTASPHTITFTVRINSQIPTKPLLVFHSSQARQQLILRAQFKAPAVPERIWWFGAPDTVDAEHAATDRIFSPDASNYYYRSFSDLALSWCYGFGWVWLPR